MADPGSAVWLERLRPTARSLHPHYAPGRNRAEIYEDVVREILAPLERGSSVCLALYGHPGVFAYPGHEAIRRARRAGFRARMLPAVSALDCLFADLGIDPGELGWQSYEATDFLVNRRSVDTTAALVLWQVSVIGERRATTTPNTEGLRVLADALRELYPGRHEVTLYQASPYPVADPEIHRGPLEDLARARLSRMATLYVPPVARSRPDPEMLERLGLAADQ